MKHPFNRAFAHKKSHRAQSVSSPSNHRAKGISPSSTSKYHNEKVEYQGILFDSKKERDRYIFLLEKQSQGIISNLETHKKYLLIPKQTYHTTEIKHLKTKDKIIEKEKCIFLSVSFSPDFVYTYKGRTIAEDVKGSVYVVSKDFPLRQKLLYYIHNIFCNVITNPTSPLTEPIDSTTP